MAIKENIAKIKSEINGALLVVVTKNRTIDEIKEAIDAGATDIGENRIQEAEQKLPLISGLKKHLIGHLQSNKAKKAVQLFDVIQSIDSLKIAQKISSACRELNKKIDVMIEVNIAGEEQKYGIKPEELENFFNQIKNLENLNIIGLMTMAPFIEPEKTRPYFRKMKELNEKLNLKFLSMGMSNDYKVAIKEGSNMVRIGTAVFENK